MKTLKEWLESIEDEKVRSEALENMEAHNDEIDECEVFTDLADALMGAFPWCETPQGGAYWIDLHAGYTKPQTT